MWKRDVIKPIGPSDNRSQKGQGNICKEEPCYKP